MNVNLRRKSAEVRRLLQAFQILGVVRPSIQHILGLIKKQKGDCRKALVLLPVVCFLKCLVRKPVARTCPGNQH